jgi:hypothetical protein
MRKFTNVILILGQDANDTSVVSRVSCQAPCEFAKSETVSGDTVIRTETFRVTPDSLVGGMLADAVSGQLMPYGHTVPVETTAAQPAPAPMQVPAAVATPASNIAALPPQPQSGDGPLQQTRFDCNQAGSIPQYLLCHNADLAAADRSLAALVQKARGAVQEQAGLGLTWLGYGIGKLYSRPLAKPALPDARSLDTRPSNRTPNFPIDRTHPAGV